MNKLFVIACMFASVAHSASSNTPLAEAVEKADFSCSKSLAITSKSNVFESTPLSMALYKNDLKSAERLLAAGADANVTSIYGGLVLLEAAYEGKLEVVRLLLKYGANVNIVDRFGRTPLFYACMEGDKELAYELIQNGANVNAKDIDGKTALIEACAYDDNFQLIELLFSKGAVVDLADNEGRTPLMFAAANGCKNTIMLLWKNKANIYATDKYGRTVNEYVGQSL